MTTPTPVTLEACRAAIAAMDAARESLRAMRDYTPEESLDATSRLRCLKNDAADLCIAYCRANAGGDAEDARRYRWLRNEANFAAKIAPQVCMVNCLNGAYEMLHGAQVDAAIDTLLAGADKENSNG